MTENLPADPIARLSAVGEALYAYGWRSDLAKALGINRTTLTRWLDTDGKWPPPPDLDSRLLAAARVRAVDLRQHLEAVEVLISALEKSTTPNP